MTIPKFTNVIEDLQWRGALSDATPGAAELLTNDKITCYNGFDPTSDSLHIGNLLPLMCLAVSSATATRRSPSSAAEPA